MATAAESTFYAAVAKAEGVRQVAKAAALATYGFAQSGLATYLSALQAADNAYLTSVVSAANTLSAAGYTIPNTGGTNPGNVNPGGFATDVVSAQFGGAYSSATAGAIG